MKDAPQRTADGIDIDEIAVRDFRGADLSRRAEGRESDRCRMRRTRWARAINQDADDNEIQWGRVCQASFIKGAYLSFLQNSLRTVRS